MMKIMFKIIKTMLKCIDFILGGESRKVRTPLHSGGGGGEGRGITLYYPYKIQCITAEKNLKKNTKKNPDKQ